MREQSPVWGEPPSPGLRIARLLGPQETVGASTVGVQLGGQVNTRGGQRGSSGSLPTLRTRFPGKDVAAEPCEGLLGPSHMC